MNEIMTMRTDLANQFAAAGAKLLDFTMTAGALAAIPNTTPQQYAVAGTLESIQAVLPAAETPARRKDDRHPTEPLSWDEGTDANQARAAVSAATKPTDANELVFNATRLRNVARLVGLEKAIPEDDATLDGARGSVLGLIAGTLRNAATKPTADLSSLTRYSMWSNGAAHGCDPAINGRWVEFDDVQSLLATKPAAQAVPEGGAA